MTELQAVDEFAPVVPEPDFPSLDEQGNYIIPPIPEGQGVSMIAPSVPAQPPMQTTQGQPIRVTITGEPNGEAGFSATFKYLDNETVEHLITFRGASALDWRAVINAMTECKLELQKAGWEPRTTNIPTPNLANVHTPYTNVSADNASAVQQNRQPVAVPVSNSADPGGDLADKSGKYPNQEFTFDCAKVVWTPKQNGDGTIGLIVEFYGDRDQYPRVKDQFNDEAFWKEKFAPWGGQNWNMGMVGEANVTNMVVTWKTANKMNTKGYYWKNFVDLGTA